MSRNDRCGGPCLGRQQDRLPIRRMAGFLWHAQKSRSGFHRVESPRRSRKECRAIEGRQFMLGCGMRTGPSMPRTSPWRGSRHTCVRQRPFGLQPVLQHPPIGGPPSDCLTRSSLACVSAHGWTALRLPRSSRELSSVFCACASSACLASTRGPLLPPNGRSYGDIPESAPGNLEE
jgi:hypothetical protein